MRLALGTVLLSPVLLFTLLGFPQEQPAKPATTLRTHTELVLVPAVVSDKNGHVSNLAKESFTLLENGRAQKIAVFEEIKTDAEKVAPLRLDPGEFANLEVRKAQRITVIAIDMINTSPLDLANLRRELVRFLEDAVSDNEPLGLVLLLPHGIYVLHDITTDKQALAMALDRYKSQQPVKAERAAAVTDLRPEASEYSPANEHQCEQFQRALDSWLDVQNLEEQLSYAQNRGARVSTLEALQQLAQMLAGIPGRKTVIWASSSFPFAEELRLVGQSEQGGMTVRYEPSRFAERVEAINYTWRLLNEANIAIYPVDARRLVNTAYEVISPEYKYSPTDADNDDVRNRFQDSVATFVSIASATGGQPCFNRTDLHNCFMEAARDSHSYYMLGFYVDRAKDPKPGWRKLDVKVDAKGAKVRARDGYYLGPSDVSADLERRADVRGALASPVSYSGLFFRGRWLETTEKGGKKTVRYELTVPAESVTVTQGQESRLDVEFAAVAADSVGKPAARMMQRVDRKLSPEAVQEVRGDGIHYRNALNLPPGTYVVHFVVRDNLAGRTGSIVLPLNVK